MANNDELIARAGRWQRAVANQKTCGVYAPNLLIQDLAAALRAAYQRIAELEKTQSALRGEVDFKANEKEGRGDGVR